MLNENQLRATGLSKHAVSRRIKSGAFEKILPRVVAIGGSPDSYLRDLNAAVLYCGQGSAASGSAAAHVWGFDGYHSPPVEVSTVQRKKPPARLPSGRELIVRRVDDRLLSEIVMIGC
ncbi:MAG TPA: hypothetical protein VEV82_04180, partial [Actinomycetota bacterium]|nr:hypothetical protein [Actinomycetota bacterium]